MALLILIIGTAAVVLVPLIIVLYLMRLPASESLWANWRQVGKKYRATFSQHGWWRPRPRLRFTYREARVELTILKRGRRRGTNLTLVHPLGIPNQGWPTPAAAALILQLKDALRHDPVALDIRSRKLDILVAVEIWSFESLIQLVRAGLSLYDQLRLVQAEGINFLDDEDVKPLEAVRCRICGENIQADLVFCRTCKTPHHLECWQYNGMCSTYACGEMEFVVPARSPEIARPETPLDAPSEDRSTSP